MPIRRPFAAAGLTLGAVLTGACALGGDSAATGAERAAVPDATPPFRVVQIARAASPLYVAQPAGDSRLFIVEQAGRIRVLKGGRLLARPFLDIRSLVTSGGEQGLLSVAFHPRFRENGRFFVYFTDRAEDQRVWELSARPGADVARASHRELLRMADPYGNHNGGQLQFGPDGYLYIGTGDGGGAGDPQRSGQRLNTLLAKLLRIDVDARSGSRPYGIPDDNPFQGRSGARPEIYSYGLRNPWRFSFDRATGALSIADVGQNAIEELNMVAKGAGRGANFGWNTYEGRSRYGGGGPLLQGGRLVAPVAQYTHSVGCSVTGGYVYRGQRIPALRGRYLYSDYCQPILRSFRFAGGRATASADYSAALRGTAGTISSFGEDRRGELYLTSLEGPVYKIVPR